ncbi:MAG: hypothetical protein LBI79_05255, partial [Nitrososphaerota archaeon]|nr:hypothetical protein [Nitrososphaerota archaeon]
KNTPTHLLNPKGNMSNMKHTINTDNHLPPRQNTTHAYPTPPINHPQTINKYLTQASLHRIGWRFLWCAKHFMDCIRENMNQEFMLRVCCYSYGANKRNIELKGKIGS